MQRADKYLKHSSIILNKKASLAKWLSFCLRAKWLWLRVPLQSLKLQISHLFQARSSVKSRQLQSVVAL